MMTGTGSQSSFYIRTKNPSRTNSQQLLKPLVVITPQKVQIINYLSDSITNVPLTIRNQSKIPKKFVVIPPFRNNFFIKCPEKSIKGKESIQFFLQFNPQKQKSIIQDQLVVKLQGDNHQIHIPIYCCPKNTPGSRPESRNTLSKRESCEYSNEIIVCKPSQRPKRFTKRSSIIVAGPEVMKKTFENDPHLYAYVNFEEKFRKISDYVRQKLVKNEVYLGAKSLSEEKEIEIQQHKLVTVKNENERLQREVTNRFIVHYANEGPIASNEVQVNLTWNLQRNIPTFTFRLGVQKIQEQVRKYVVSLRFQRIQNSLKIYDQFKKKAENQERKVKIEDYVQFLQNRLKQNILASDYDFEFDSVSIQPTMLPIQPQFRSIQATFQISQRVGFDNWIPMNILKPNFQEVFSQQEIEFPSFFYHHPIATNGYKKGGLSQMPFKQSDQFTLQQIESFLEVSPQEGVNGLQSFKQVLEKKQKMFHYTQVEEEDKLEEYQLMNLGPLNPLRWNKRPNTSIDMYSSIKY